MKRSPIFDKGKTFLSTTKEIRTYTTHQKFGILFCLSLFFQVREKIKSQKSWRKQNAAQKAEAVIGFYGWSFFSLIFSCHFIFFTFLSLLSLRQIRKKKNSRSEIKM